MRKPVKLKAVKIAAAIVCVPIAFFSTIYFLGEAAYHAHSAQWKAKSYDVTFLPVGQWTVRPLHLTGMTAAAWLGPDRNTVFHNDIYYTYQVAHSNEKCEEDSDRCSMTRWKSLHPDLVHYLHIP